MGTGCPDPLNPDSDGDTLSDGVEVTTLGTNPCNPDSDGDGVPDQIDPNPLDPGEVGSELEQAKRLLAEFIAGLDLNLFIGQNDNAKTGRRNSMATRVQNAANACSQGNLAAATALLQTVLEQVDGQAPPPDWMDGSSEKTSLADDLNLLVALLQQQLQGFDRLQQSDHTR